MLLSVVFFQTLQLITDSKMAEAVISAAVEVALSKAISILEDPINLAWDFKHQLNKLRPSLALTRSFLQDAERRQLDEPVKLWLQQLSDAACKADMSWMSLLTSIFAGRWTIK
ncbi:hypothetical protein V6N12_038034 [Hibiscus sabdariffa]|uniref:Disease resistance N-terminal domain-containing protein n=1 Tax=Hibiscus sabdariffa TaxID=183260 RepID=A0ABR2BWJ6_9ROSI